ncbi:MAG TPA: hypothetical protein VLJ37_08585 [bacterium]|nr:hypothetical protein [bacterium]
MVQKQLERFARAGILESRFQGRRKVYSWNREYPLLKELRLVLRKGQEGSSDPADGSHLSLQERVWQSEALIREAEAVNPRHRPVPFTKSFDSFASYERWRKRQNNPWLV